MGNIFNFLKKEANKVLFNQIIKHRSERITDAWIFFNNRYL
jgi:hypothetical protein